jgi:hypothetical protein
MGAAPIRLVLDFSPLGPGAVQWCGFDPQNTLQTGDGRTIHARFLQVCGGPAMSAVFDHPVVQFETGRLVASVESIAVTDSGNAVHLTEGSAAEIAGLRATADGITVEAAHATVRRNPGLSRS